MDEKIRLEDLDKYRRTTQLDFALEALRQAVLSGELKIADAVRSGDYEKAEELIHRHVTNSYTS